MKSKKMKINSKWNDVTLLCGNHSEEEHIEAIFTSGQSVFYACPHFYPKEIRSAVLAVKAGDDTSSISLSEYEKQINTASEPRCFNRLSLYEYEKMLNHLSSEIAEAEFDGTVLNLTNYKFKLRGVEYTVIKHDGRNLVVKYINKKAITNV